MRAQLTGWLQVLAIIFLMPVGSIAGALSGVLVLGPIFAVLLPLTAATIFLGREGIGWRDITLATPLPASRLVGWTAATLVITWVMVLLTSTLLVALDVPPVDYSFFVTLIEGDFSNYLLFVIPVAWGSAAIGEELLARGFLMHRIKGLTNTPVAVVLQALLFALAHFYQGLFGMINIFVLALIFGIVFVRTGRNLIPLILAHGTIDTISLTLVYFGRVDLLAGA